MPLGRKKNIISEPVKSSEQPKLQPEEAVQAQEEILEAAEIDNSEQPEAPKAKKPERMETDQEKMVLELFDGKYIE